MLEHRIDQRFTVTYSYPVCFTRKAFSPDNPVLAELMRMPEQGMKARALVLIDSGVAASRDGYIESIERYAYAHRHLFELAHPPVAMRGGEAAKHGLREVEPIYDLVREMRICRHSYVVAIGGGAVLDAAGYAAATAHRGVRLIRMPSTVLAQNDAGIGVKNGVNWYGRKNFVGAFASPFAVVNDFDLLASAPSHVRRAGIAEAIKVALIRDEAFFAQLHQQRFELADLAPHAIEPMIVRCAQLHLAQIRNGGDPFERGSARPLDFGHWAAHKLEELSQHRLLHGEAVAIGIALDTLYSQHIGLIDGAAVDLVLDTMRDIGFVLDDPVLDELDLERALADFREHLGGLLCITLLKGIGEGIEVDRIDMAAMRECVARLRVMRQAVQAVRAASEVST
ncbi:3-dehydroquinate synthase [Trinickia sp. NRRL B-1857]|uniref:3-dehydroquinate synthase n=1 Tax=Trinickia sp. NRRL B-1857 TaxID=3162879 RepID=UPI003D27CE36